MTPASNWTVSVLAILCMVLFLNHVGLNVTADLGTLLRGTEHFLAQPLLVR